MLININCRFFHNQQKKNLANFFRILQLSTRLPSSYDSHVGPFFPILQLCTCLPSSYDSDLGPFCSRQLRGLPSSDGYFLTLHIPWRNRGQHFSWCFPKAQVCFFIDDVKGGEECIEAWRYQSPGGLGYWQGPSHLINSIELFGMDEKWLPVVYFGYRCYV